MENYHNVLKVKLEKPKLFNRGFWVKHTRETYMFIWTFIWDFRYVFDY